MRIICLVGMRCCWAARPAFGTGSGGLLVPSAHAQQPQPKRGGVMRVAGAEFLDRRYARSGARQQRHRLLAGCSCSITA